MKLFLIGMPGSGKSYLGRKIAVTFKLQFIDLDNLIEVDEKIMIKDLIQLKGEEYFRQKESEKLKSFERKNQTLVSCGGGTPIYSDNLEWMKKNGIVIWLDADLSILSARIFQNVTRRPMFLGLSLPEISQKLANLLQKRKKYYQKAHIIVRHNTNESKMLSSVIQQVTQILKTKK